MSDPGLYRHPWYFGKITRNEAEAQLKDLGENEGSFLVRESTNRDTWSVSVLNWNGVDCSVGHYLVSKTARNRVYFEEQLTFDNIGDLIEFYRKNPGRLAFNLREPCPKEYFHTTDDYGYTIYDVPMELSELEIFIKKNMIYHGSIGENWKGFLASSPTVQLIGKFPKNEEDAEYALKHEANMMRKLAHENIIRLFGVITRPSFILISYDAGDMSLVRYLLQDGGAELTTAQELEIAQQIASALDHCRRMKCIHRNVKARSVVINSSNKTCKLASLKYCRFQDDHGYFHATREEDKNPVKIGSRVRWMAIEAAREGRFSTASDVWSFAVFMLELFSRGGLPYSGYLTCKVLSEVEGGYRCPRPYTCPVEVYSLMTACWDIKESNRPSFTAIRKFLINYLKDNREVLSKLTPPAPSDCNPYTGWKPEANNTIRIKQPRTKGNNRYPVPPKSPDPINYHV